MKKFLATGLSAIALVATAAPAQALTDLGDIGLVDINPGDDFFSFFIFFDGATPGSPMAAGDYLITYTFGFDEPGVGAGDVSASLVSGDNTVFSSVLFNGSPFSLSGGSTLGHISGAPVVGPAPPLNEIEVYFSVLTDGIGAFSGSVSATSVPEPATWAMMLAGFGLVGAGLRRKDRNVRVRFAV